MQVRSTSIHLKVALTILYTFNYLNKLMLQHAVYLELSDSCDILIIAVVVDLVVLS